MDMDFFQHVIMPILSVLILGGLFGAVVVAAVDGSKKKVKKKMFKFLDEYEEHRKNK